MPSDSSNSLVAWLRASGGAVHEGLDLCHALPSGDRGIVATAPLEEGALLLRVPERCTLTAPLEEDESALKSGLGVKRGAASSAVAGSSGGSAPSYAACLEYLRSLTPAPSPFVACVLLYLHETLSGTASPFVAYFDALPAEVDCLLLWGDADKKELQGTSTDVGGELLDDGLAAAFRRVVEPTLAARPDLFPAEPLALAAAAAVAALRPAAPAAGAASGSKAGSEPADAVSSETGALAVFRRAAAMVQSRAFHMERHNWVTGEAEECLDLFLIPGVDMVNHATDPTRRNTELLRVPPSPAKGDAPASVGGFELRASRAIAVGEQVLHTYGDMADARLLQIYGFVDTGSAAPVPPAAVPPPAKAKAAAAGKKASGSKAAPAAVPAPAAEPKFVNPNNSTLVPWPLLLSTCRAVISGGKDAEGEESEEEEEEAPKGKGKAAAAPAPKGKRGRSSNKAEQKAKKAKKAAADTAVLTALEKRQVALLQRVGLLQPSDPASSFFVLTAEDPLPSELLTTLQVLLMAAGELKQLERHTKDAKPEDAGALALGTQLMEAEPDFGEIVCMAAVQLADACMARYGTSADDDALTLLRLRNKLTHRQLFAILVRQGEKDVLRGCKKAALALLMQMMQDAGGESEEEEEEEGESGDGDDDDEDVDPDDDILYNSDDSDKVGLADLPVDDDGVGAVHDRGASHAVPPPTP